MIPLNALGILEAVGAVSESLVTWSLAVVAGSVAAIVSTSYIRPTSSGIRLAYLLFLPGWGALAGSIVFGDRIARWIVTAHQDPSRLREISRHISNDFASQQDLFLLGLAPFGLWLVIYLLWWVFGEWAT